jgi:hypothetical protein
MFAGGGFWVVLNLLSTVPFALLALTVQTNSLAKYPVLAVTLMEVPEKPKGTPLPDQVALTLVVFEDHLPGSQVIIEPVRAVPTILGSTTTLGNARFCFVSFIKRVGIPTELMVSM